MNICAICASRCGGAGFGGPERTRVAGGPKTLGTAKSRSATLNSAGCDDPRLNPIFGPQFGATPLQRDFGATFPSARRRRVHEEGEDGVDEEGDGHQR